MPRRALLWFLAAALLAAPTVASHDAHNGQAPGEGPLPQGTYLDHTELWEATLGPGSWLETRLAWEGLPFREGWSLVFDGHLAGSDVAATLLFEDLPPMQWTWEADGSLFHAVRVPAAEAPVLRLENPGNGTAEFVLYHDVSCDCTSKVLRHMPGTLLLAAPPDEGRMMEGVITVVPFQEPHAHHGPDGPLGNISLQLLVMDVDEEGLRPLGDPLQADFPSDAEHRELAFLFDAPTGTEPRLLAALQHDGGPGWHLQVRSEWVPVDEGLSNVAPLWMALAVVAALTVAFLGLSRFGR